MSESESRLTRDIRWQRLIMRLVLLAGAGVLVYLLAVVLLAEQNTDVTTPVPTAPPPPTWEEVRNRSREVGYREWFRNWGVYQGASLYFRGQVKQVIDDGGTDQTAFSSLRIDVLPTEYGQYLGRGIIYLHGLVHPRGNRLLKDDLVEFVGIAESPLTYQTVLGASITVPAMKAEMLRTIPLPARRGAQTTGAVRSR